MRKKVVPRVAVAVVLAVLSVAAQPSDSRAVIARTQQDLSRSLEFERHKGKEIARYDNAQHHLSDFDKELTRGHWDKGKLDEYLTSVREVEKRVEGMRRDKADADDAAQAKNTIAATMERPANGLPEDLREHSRLMCDIIAIAFQTNKTRVASLIISHDLSAMYYPFLNVKDGHHSASHNNNSDDYERISRFHVEQYAYLASKLDSMKEGNGTVLDNTCLMFLSNMWIGRKHDNFRLPLVLAGGLGGTLQTGRTLNYLNDSEDNRKMCSLYLSLMDRYNVKVEQFGDSQTRLERL